MEETLKKGIVYGLAAYGSVCLTARLWSILGFVNRNYLRFEANHYTKYADKESWVLITGGSDGIGEEICNQMAALGFNVCIVARNKEKMEKVLARLKEKNKDIKTRAVVADFATMFKI